MLELEVYQYPIMYLTKKGSLIHLASASYEIGVDLALCLWMMDFQDWCWWRLLIDNDIGGAVNDVDVFAGNDVNDNNILLWFFSLFFSFNFHFFLSFFWQLEFKKKKKKRRYLEGASDSNTKIGVWWKKFRVYSRDLMDLEMNTKIKL